MSSGFAAASRSYPITFQDWGITPTLNHSYLGESINHLGEMRPIFDDQQLDMHLAVISHRWSCFPDISVNLNNLFDKRGLTADIKQGNVRDVIYSQPRTLILRLSGQF